MNEMKLHKDKVADEAADWLLRLEEQDSAEVREAFELWYQSSSLHQQAFDKMQALWQLAQQLPSPQAVEQQATVVPLQATAKPVKGRGWIMGFGLAAGLALAVGLTLFNGPRPVYQTPTVVNQQADSLRFSTDTGQLKRVQLDDGSWVQLGARSEMVVHIDAQQRLIELLSGEARFDVAKDASRPFTVTHRGHQAMALGTVFDVKVARQAIEVSVLEGKVAVEGTAQPTQPALLTAGQQVSIEQDGRLSEITDKVPSSEWLTGRLRYINTPLADVIYDVQRYSHLTLYINSPKVAAYSYTGSIKSDGIDTWLQSLPKIYPLSLQQSADTVVLTEPVP